MATITAPTATTVSSGFGYPSTIAGTRTATASAVFAASLAIAIAIIVALTVSYGASDTDVGAVETARAFSAFDGPGSHSLAMTAPAASLSTNSAVDGPGSHSLTIPESSSTSSTFSGDATHYEIDMEVLSGLVFD